MHTILILVMHALLITLSKVLNTLLVTLFYVYKHNPYHTFNHVDEHTPNHTPIYVDAHTPNQSDACSQNRTLT